MILRKSFQNLSLLTQIPILGIQEGQALVHVTPVQSTNARIQDQTTTTTTTTTTDTLSLTGLDQLTLSTLRVTSSYLCSICHCGFDLAEELRIHNKSIWHVHNAQQSSASRPILTEEQFDNWQQTEQLTKNKIDTKSSSSTNVDGSDTESSSSDSDTTKPIAEDDFDSRATIGSSQVTFATTTQLITIWKACLIPTKHILLTSPLSARIEYYISSLRTLPTYTNIAIFMAHGGRFAGGIFNNTQCLLHKSFARYTTRRKQGGSQATADGAKSIKSAGSTIRRQEAIRFTEELHRVLSDWSTQLSSCQLIFLFAPSSNRTLFLSHPTFSTIKSDERVRNIPFVTQRPSSAEILRVHAKLTTIEFADKPEHWGLSTYLTPSTADDTTIPTSTSKSSDIVTSVPDIPRPIDLLLQAITNNDLGTVQQLLAEHYQRPEPTVRDPHRPLLYHAIATLHYGIAEWLLQQTIGKAELDEIAIDTDGNFPIGWTALHKACSLGSVPLITLLLESGANPCQLDSRQRNLWAITQLTDARLTLRRFAGQHPDKWDWQSIGIEPLTSTDEETQRKLKAEKEKARKKAQQQRQKEKKKVDAEAAVQQAALDEAARTAALRAANEQADASRLAQELKATSAQRTQTLAGMSEREKRALAAESRIAATTGKAVRCDACSTPIIRVPFQRLTYSYCSMPCLLRHKDVLDGKPTTPAVSNGPTSKVSSASSGKR